MAVSPCTLFVPGAGAYEFVSKEYQTYVDRVRNLSTDAAADIASLQAYLPDFASTPYEISTALIDGIQVPILELEKVDLPIYDEPIALYTAAPPVRQGGTQFDDGSDLRSIGSAPTPDFGSYSPRVIRPPTLSFPDSPGAAPDIEAGVVPDAPSVSLPDAPLLNPISAVPDLPLVDIPDFIAELKKFEKPLQLQDLYYPEMSTERDRMVAIWNSDEVKNVEFEARVLKFMYQGGSGLDPSIEAAFIQRQNSAARNDVIKAKKEAREYWAEQGFELPGSTVLAAVREAEFEGQQNYGRTHREMSTKFYEEMLATQRLAFTEGLQHERELRKLFLDLDENARKLVVSHYDILKLIYDVSIAVYDLEIRVYTAEIQVFEAKIRIALGRVEVFRAQIEALKVEAELNTQLIEQYEAQVRGELAKVELYKGQIDAFNGIIRAELGKVEAFRGKVDAYTAEIGAVGAVVDVYEAEVRGETAQVNAYEAQVNAYRARIDGYNARINAEATKTSSINDVVKAESDVYAADVEAWSAGVTADVRRVEATVSQFRGEIEAYVAQLNSSEVEERLKTLGFEKELEKAKLAIQTQIGDIDRALEVLKTSSTLEQQKLTDAAKINAQLAAASMASLSLSANLSGSDSWSAGSSSTCSTSYSGLI